MIEEGPQHLKLETGQPCTKVKAASSRCGGQLLAKAQGRGGYPNGACNGVYAALQ